MFWCLEVLLYSKSDPISVIMKPVHKWKWLLLQSYFDWYVPLNHFQIEIFLKWNSLASWSDLLHFTDPGPDPKPGTWEGPAFWDQAFGGPNILLFSLEYIPSGEREENYSEVECKDTESQKLYIWRKLRW